jgi:hypothetical protein
MKEQYLKFRDNFKNKLKYKYLAAVLICLAFVGSYNFITRLLASPSPAVQFTADVNVNLTGLSAGDLQVANGSECGQANISGSGISIVGISDAGSFTLKTPEHSRALKLSPSGGTVDLVVSSANISSGNILRWTITASSNISIAYVVGVPQANTIYNVKIDNVSLANYTSNSSSEIEFTFTGSGTSRIFTVEQDTASGGAATIPSSGMLLPPIATTTPAGKDDYKVIIKPVATTTPETPTQEPEASIKETRERKVILELTAPKGTKEIMISEDPQFDGAKRELFEKIKELILSEGFGKKTIYIKFFGENGSSAETSIDVNLLPPKPDGEASEIIPRTQSPYNKPIKHQQKREQAIKMKIAGERGIYKGLSATVAAEFSEKIVLAIKEEVKEIKQFFKHLSVGVSGEIIEKISLKIKSETLKIKNFFVYLFDIFLSSFTKIIPDFIKDIYRSTSVWIKNELLKFILGKHS